MEQYTTASQAVEMRQINPTATLEQISKDLGVTKQRISQIFKKGGIPGRANRPKKLILCKECLQEKKIKRLKLCEDCYKEKYYTTVLCNYCGAPQILKKSGIKKRIENGNNRYGTFSCCYAHGRLSMSAQIKKKRKAI